MIFKREMTPPGAAWRCVPPPRRTLNTDLLAGQHSETEEGELFDDYDHLRGLGQGYYTYGAPERLTRRVDLRAEHEIDPGPIEALEAVPNHGGLELSFQG